jgi:hypothetical protein
MSFVKIWMVVFAVILFAMTSVLFHSFGHKETNNTTKASNGSSMATAGVLLPGTVLDPPEQILLLPFDGISQLSTSRRDNNNRRRQEEVGSIQLQPWSVHSVGSSSAFGGPRRFLKHLRQEFEDWMTKHSKSYRTEDEKEFRFSIWVENHQRTIKKNERHGPCKLTKQPVFGSNHLKDLTPDEFKSKYLTGYKGAFTDELERRKNQLPPGVRQLRQDSGIVLNPKIHKVNMHESVKRRHLMHHPQAMGAEGASFSTPKCAWYDVSCMLRWLWRSTGIQFGTLVGTMEPKYDSEAYPNAVDWRYVCSHHLSKCIEIVCCCNKIKSQYFYLLLSYLNRDIGAVSAVRTQGECGACWAVTAVETVESAVYIASGTLYELSETEIIACDDSCLMCSGECCYLSHI